MTQTCNKKNFLTIKIFRDMTLYSGFAKRSNWYLKFARSYLGTYLFLKIRREQLQTSKKKITKWLCHKSYLQFGVRKWEGGIYPSIRKM